MKSIYAILLGLMMVLSPIASLLIVPAEADRRSPEDIGLGFLKDESWQVANVEPGANHTVVFPCYVDSRNFFYFDPGPDEVSFDLDCSNIYNWPCSIDHTRFRFSTSKKDYFNVTVFVPPETTSKVTEAVIVNARITTIPDGETYTSEVRGTIEVEQFYSVEVYCEDTKKSMVENELAKFKIDISNKGNGEDTVRSYILNIDELAGSGLIIFLSDYLLYVPEKSKKEIFVYVETNDIIEYRTYEIEIEVESESAGVSNSSYEPEMIILKIDINRDPVQFYSIIGFVILMAILVVIVIIRIQKKRPGLK